MFNLGWHNLMLAQTNLRKRYCVGYVFAQNNLIALIKKDNKNIFEHEKRYHTQVVTSEVV